MKEAHVVIRTKKFDCFILPGKYTSNPQSSFCHPEDVKDERVPEDCVIFCGEDKSIHVLPWRYESKVAPGRVICTRICVDEDELQIAPDNGGIDAFWRSDWRSIKCHSIGHAEFILNLLTTGSLEDIEMSAQVQLVKGSAIPKEPVCAVSS